MQNDLIRIITIAMVLTLAGVAAWCAVNGIFN